MSNNKHECTKEKNRDQKNYDDQSSSTPPFEIAEALSSRDMQETMQPVLGCSEDEEYNLLPLLSVKEHNLIFDLTTYLTVNIGNRT